MKTAIENAQKYLSSMMEDRPRWQPLSPGSLPFHLAKRFSYHQVELFGNEWVLAVEADDRETGTPKEYRKLGSLLASAFSHPLVFVLPSMNARTRNRLVQMDVPFVVPGSQVFLPMTYINLKETYPGKTTAEGLLSPAAQVLVLHQILHDSFRARSSRQIAELLGYSNMSISNARGDLEVRELCECFREGKAVHMVFPPARGLWERSRPYLASPVQKRFWFRWGGERLDGLLLSGYSALSRQTSLADDDRPCYAATRSNIRSLIEQGSLQRVELEEDADAQLEQWRYDPQVLASETVVDPLSLYLSLQDDPDERVQGELDELMKVMSWR